MTKQRAFWTVAALALGLVVVQSARSEPTGSPKVFKNGDVLTAEDLNASFAASVGGSSAPYVWSAFGQAQQDLGRLEGAGLNEGRVATFNFSSPIAGEVFVTASYEIRVRNSFDKPNPDQCRLQTVLSETPSNGFPNCVIDDSCNLPGYAQTSLSANLPTQLGAGSYVGFSQTASRVLPLKQGLNTFYLLGRTECPAGIWGAITFTAISVQKGGTATVSIP